MIRAENITRCIKAPRGLTRLLSPVNIAPSISAMSISVLPDLRIIVIAMVITTPPAKPARMAGRNSKGIACS